MSNNIVTQSATGSSQINFNENQETQDLSSSDNDSDLDLDVADLARRPCPESVPEIVVDIDLASNDEEEQSTSTASHPSSSPYSLRKRGAPVSYKGQSEHSDDEEISLNNDRRRKKTKPTDLLDLTVLLKRNAYSHKQLNKYIRKPQLTEELSRWTLNSGALTAVDLANQEQFELVQKFIEKCAQYLDHLVLICDAELGLLPKIESLLLNIFKNAKLLKKFTMKYHKVNREEDTGIQNVLKIIQTSGQKSLNSLKIVGHGDGIITRKEFNTLISLSEEGQLKWTHLELGDALWEDVDGEAVQKLLESSQNTLERFVVHGGIKMKDTNSSSENKSRFTIKFPKKMSQLKELSICPKYNFVSDSFDHRNNPCGKRWREIRLDTENNDKNEQGTPVKITLSFDHTDFPKLEKVVLGNLVEIDECGFALIRKLKVFRCGSRWDLAIRFPKTESKKVPSGLKDLQLPDGLKDPSFVQNVATFFPFLNRVWVFLPSVPVLRTFFKCYQNSKDLEELYLNTQFDFETLLESCILPQLSGVRGLSDMSKTVIRTLKEYKHFADYVRYHNIELPLDQEELEDLQGNNSAGIGALKSLKVLHLNHIPRTLPIPNPEDERRWYDHNFKYLNTTFGFRNYPFSYPCHKEILGMNLMEYRWGSLSIAISAANEFIDEGYRPMNLTELAEDNNRNSDEDLFIIPESPNSSLGRNKKGINVTVKPSMLIPNHFSKNKREN